MVLRRSIRSFNLDALAGAVPLNVDLDVVLSVLALRQADLPTIAVPRCTRHTAGRCLACSLSSWAALVSPPRP